MSWTLSDIRKLEQAGKIKGFKEIGGGSKTASKLPKVPQGEPEGIAYIKRLLSAACIPFECEYRFHDVRKFRFDIAILDQKLAIEYEGIFSKKSRHTTQTGYNRDADKYNLAQSLGWRVFRYTAMNYKNFETDIKVIR